MAWQRQAVFPLILLLVVVTAIVFELRDRSAPADGVERLSASGQSGADAGRPSGRLIARANTANPAAIGIYFQADRLQRDQDYRRIIWLYLLRRDFEQSLPREPALADMARMFESRGIPPELALDLVRLAREQISDMQRFEEFEHDVHKAKEAKFRQILASALSEEEKAGHIKRAEMMAAVVSSQWSRSAAAVKAGAIALLKRETGIDEEAFYEELFLVRLAAPAAALAMSMAENEALFGP